MTLTRKNAASTPWLLRKMLIRTGHRRNQLAASTEDLKRTLLCFAADQINDSVRIPNLFLKALGPVVNHRVCAEVAHKGDVIGRCGRDGSHTRATGQAEPHKLQRFLPPRE